LTEQSGRFAASHVQTSPRPAELDSGTHKSAKTVWIMSAVMDATGTTNSSRPWFNNKPLAFLS
jgi:hypothetical protein